MEIGEVDFVIPRKEERGTRILFRGRRKEERGRRIVWRQGVISFLVPPSSFLVPRQVEALRFIWSDDENGLIGGDLKGGDDKALMTIQSLTAGQFQRFSLSLSDKGGLFCIR
jgi:hypothetical protein